jgi:hypothetical protein
VVDTKSTREEKQNAGNNRQITIFGRFEVDERDERTDSAEHRMERQRRSS